MVLNIEHCSAKVNPKGPFTLSESVSKSDNASGIAWKGYINF